MVQNL
jgi:hypothetical protein